MNRSYVIYVILLAFLGYTCPVVRFCSNDLNLWALISEVNFICEKQNVKNGITIHFCGFE